MFFILSKVLTFLIRPIIWALALIILGLWARKPKRQRRFVMIGFAIIYFFSIPYIFDTVCHQWEYQSITADQITTPYDIGVLLGGYSAHKVKPSHDRYNFNERANRFNNTIELYFKGKVKKILLTGGSGSLDEPKFFEAKEVAKYLATLGIPKEDIIIESLSRNTHENALFTEAILNKQVNRESKLLLITSAWHMRRAMGCFEKEGLVVTPFSVDFLTESVPISLQRLFYPNTFVLVKWEILIKEWVGYVVYSVVGYI